jgi:hypothetical protein
MKNFVKGLAAGIVWGGIVRLTFHYVGIDCR